MRITTLRGLEVHPDHCLAKSSTPQRAPQVPQRTVARPATGVRRGLATVTGKRLGLGQLAHRRLDALPDVHGRDQPELTDAQWARLQPLLPPQRPTTGRSNKDRRLILEAIIWLDRTGAPWRDLPACYGPWRTVASRFYRWRRQGIFDRLLADVQRQADACGELNWLVHVVDGSVVLAHQHAAGTRHQPAIQDIKGGSRATVE